MTTGAAGVLWVVGAGLMIAGAFDLRFMGWGIWVTAVAAVLTIRRMLCTQDQKARNAFELGRDYERADADGSVRSLH